MPAEASPSGMAEVSAHDRSDRPHRQRRVPNSHRFSTEITKCTRGGAKVSGLAASPVVLSKSIVPSKPPDVRIQWLMVWRIFSPFAVKYPAPLYGLMVAPKTLTHLLQFGHAEWP